MKVEVHRHSKETPWSYADLVRRQQAIRDEVLRGEPGRVVFSEVAPVITLGYRKTREDLLLSQTEYAALGIGIEEVSRGGRATYHGPGQWVVFVVDSLENLTGDRKGVRKFVDALFTSALAVCKERFFDAEIREGKEAGVWSCAGHAGMKLAALGVQIDQGVTQHGLSLNIFSTKESFTGLRPCGLGAPVGFLESAGSPAEFPDTLSTKEREVKFLEWRQKLESALALQFGI